MCGIAGMFGQGWMPEQLEAMIASQHHRGPDSEGIYLDPGKQAGLGHNRLSIIDLSELGHQPMRSASGHLHIVFNGEIYNYRELREELADYPYSSRTDTEVILAAYERWGEDCLEHFIGMFSFLIWDERRQVLFAARDRFGVKPLYFHQKPRGPLMIASEIRALWAGGAPADPDEATWSAYLAKGAYGHSRQTFWKDIYSLDPGHLLRWESGRVSVRCWYDVAKRIGGEYDQRDAEAVRDEYLDLLENSVRLRFRADVPVGISLSGGLDSSTLCGLVQSVQGRDSDVTAFTYITGHPDYDELPWVQKMLQQTRHSLVVCELKAAEVPSLAESVQLHQSEPFGGIPTLAYARLFEVARSAGVITLLDGQGMDEQWAGYDYYTTEDTAFSPVQGARQRPIRPDCLSPEFAALAQSFCAPSPFPDGMRNRQYWDTRYTKIPKALRFNDIVSMRSSTELREPFLDHRLFELALRQPPERKIFRGTRKYLLRQIARDLLPNPVVEAPKRPVQTPQREWLQGPLFNWASEWIATASHHWGGIWLDVNAVQREWQQYQWGAADNSFFVWQWISLGMITGASQRATV